MDNQPAPGAGKNAGERQMECLRCGKCCMESSPTLVKKDLPLIPSQKIRYSHIYTIRKEELVNNNIDNLPEFTPVELIKLREKNSVGGGCIFFYEPDKSCSIYKSKPAQCTALKCWDTDELIDLINGPKITREEIVRDNVLMGLIREHETRCSYSLVREYVEEIPRVGEKAVKKIMDILRFDHQIRPFVCEKLHVEADETDFFFGRRMTDTIKMFGLEVVREPDGSFLLTTKKGS